MKIEYKLIIGGAVFAIASWIVGSFVAYGGDRQPKVDMRYHDELSDREERAAVGLLIALMGTTAGVIITIVGSTLWLRRLLS